MHSMGIRRALAVIRLSARSDLYFGKVYLVGTYLLRLVQLMVMLMVWRALFLQGADTGGMGLGQLLAYSILGNALSHMLDVRTQASNWLHEGGVLSLYQRPMGIFSQLTLETLGKWLPPTAIYALPVLLAAGFAGLRVAPVTPLALASLLLCLSQGFAVDYLFACLILRARNISWPIHSLRGALTAMLTGGVIPFAALPWGIGEILQYSPLGTLAGAPLSIWVGLTQPFPLLWVQLLWNITLWPLAIWCFARSQERMVSYGG